MFESKPDGETSIGVRVYVHPLTHRCVREGQKFSVYQSGVCLQTVKQLKSKPTELLFFYEREPYITHDSFVESNPQYL